MIGRMRAYVSTSLKILLILIILAGTDMRKLQVVSAEGNVSEINAVSIDRIRSDVELFSSLKSRFTGYSGFYDAARIIYGRFKELQLEASLFNYSQLVPYDEGSWLKVEGQTIEAFALYPNSIATGERKAYGKLVYAGHGMPGEFNGLEVKDNIVLLEFDSGNAWVTAMALGASAVVFLDNGPITRYEAMAKLSSLPLTIPRLYVTGEAASKLRAISARRPYAELFNGMRWKEVVGMDIVGEMRGTEDPSNVIIVLAHYDSASVVPAISPGADDSLSISIMLELIRVLKKTGFSPRHTVWFIATSGHWQGLSGAREFVEKTYFNNPRIGDDVKPYLAVSLELTSGSPHVNLVLAGMMYGINTNPVFKKMSDLSRLLSEVVANFSRFYPVAWSRIGTTVLFSLTGLGQADSFRSGAAFKFNLDMEEFQLANSIALGVVTFDDARLSSFTPYDTIGSVDFGNVLPQCQFATFVLKNILEAPISSIYSGPWEDLKPPESRIGPAYTGVGFATLYVETVKYSPTNPGLYVTVPNALVVIGNPVDPFSLIVTKSNSSGVAEIHGMQPLMTAAAQANILISSYVIDEEGRITHAPDRGYYGMGHNYPSSIQVFYDAQKTRSVVFECGSAAVFDIVGPSLQSAYSPNSFYQNTNAYSTELARALYESPLALSVTIVRIPGYTSFDSYGYAFDPRIGVVLVFAPPRARFGLVMKSSALSKTTTIFANVTLSNQDGYGYYIEKEGDRLMIDSSVTGLLREPLTLAYGRYLAQKGIQVMDPVTMKYLEFAEELNRTFSGSILGKDYQTLMANSLLAWGFSVKSYDSSLNVLKDAVTSIIIAFSLAIPFILLFAALIYGLSRGFRSIVLVGAIAIVVSVILTFFHPGFRLVVNIPAIFMGTLLIALAIPVLFFLIVNTSSSLSELRKKVFGTHFFERSGFEVSFTSVTIGISNLRKRKFRTILTLASIVMVGFALTSLTSVTEIRVLRVTPMPTQVKYNGVIIRTANFFPLDEKALSLVAAYLTNSTEFAGRYWVYMPTVTRGGAMGTIIVSAYNKSTEVNVLSGISPLELKASFVDYREFLNGSMFSDDDMFSAIITNDLASGLGVDIGDHIMVEGIRLKVVGKINTTSMLAKVKDSDGFMDVLPVDTYRMSFEKATGISPSYTLNPNYVIFVPYKLVRLIPEASLTSAFIPIDGLSFDDVRNKVETLFSAFDGLNIYLTYDGTVYQFSKSNEVSLFGFQLVLIPMIIAGLITMSTILGGIIERIREGYVYSSLGLGPLQVGLMFLGENLVYAIVGSVIGYLSGISISYFLRELGVLQVSVNYSSSFVSIVIGSVILIVLLASLYPMYKMATIITPSLERKWRLPTKPKGDAWEIPIPFRVKDEEKAAGMAVFLHEYLWNKRIERAGGFTVEAVETNRIEDGISIKARIWLAPFEQNIRQDMDITIIKSKTEQRFLVFLNLLRVSGPYDSWVRFNYPFVDEVRKQMLVWSLLKPEEENRYIKSARERGLLGVG